MKTLSNFTKEKSFFLAVGKGDGMIGTNSKLNIEEIEYTKEHKPEILAILLEEKKERLAEEKKQRDEIAKEYSTLKKTFPKVKIPETDNDEEKFQELITKAKSHFSNGRQFNGTEDEGLAMSCDSAGNKVMSEARKHCTHEIKTEYDYGYTEDARLKIEREITCEKCGLKIRNEVREKLDDNSR